MSSVIICTGLTTIDVCQVVSALPLPNQKISAENMRLSVGGPAASAARVAHSQGCQVRLVTALGCSAFAEFAREELAGIDIVDVAPPDHQIPISTIFLTPDGGRGVVSRNAQALRSTALPDPEILADADAVLHDGHLLAVSMMMAEYSALLHLLDGGSWKPGLEKLLPLLDIAVISGDFAFPASTPDRALDELTEYGIPRLARSRGGEPVETLIGSERVLIPVPEVDVVDSTGAGDVLHGSLIAEMAAGTDFSVAMRRAIVCASESVAHFGIC